MIDSFWLKAFSEKDFAEYLKQLDLPTMIIHGDDDQIRPDRCRQSQRDGSPPEYLTLD